jgi:transcriptional regulator with XRE-family HTH domain
MDVANLIRDVRLAEALTQTELAKRAGTSQPTLAAYEAGRAEPRLDTLERLVEAGRCELVVTVRPKVRRGAAPIAEAAEDIATLLVSEGRTSAWRRLLDFVDDFRGSSTADKRWLAGGAPAGCGERCFDSAIAALVEFLCTEAGLSYPAWTDDPECFAAPWWFVSGLPVLEATALRDSPVSFVRHGVFVNEGAFTRV